MAKESYVGKFFLSRITSHGKRQRIFVLRKNPSPYKGRKFWDVLVEEGFDKNVNVDGYVINQKDSPPDDPLDFQPDFARKIFDYFFSGSKDSLKLQSMLGAGR